MSLTKVTYSMIDGALVNVLDYGAVGDGLTDDSTALTLAIASLPNHGGTIFFPAGDYVLSSAFLIEPAVGRDFVSNLHFKGVGGHHTDLGTRIQLNGGTGSVAGMTLKSAVQMSFEDINFIGATSALALVKIQANGPIPAYSSFNIEFNRCRFAAATPINALVWVNNCSNITFNNCFFQGAQIAVQVGSISTDAENVGTFSTGTADAILFIQCFLAGDVVNYRCRGSSYDSCTFDANAVLTPVGSKMYAAGQQLVRGLNIQNCWFGYGNNTDYAITLGSAGYDLTAINNFFSTYEKAIYLDGIGVSHIEGNEFALNSSGAAAIYMVATFYGANVQNNHYTGMNATSYFVQDARETPGSPVAIAPVEVNASLTPDYTITNAGVGYEDVLAVSVKLTGGLYRLQGAVTITTGASASVFKARIITDIVMPRVSGLIYLPANTQGTIQMSRDVFLSGTTTATTARLQIYQVTAGTNATIEATDTVNTTMMQFTRAAG